MTDLDLINLILALYDDHVGADPKAWDALCTTDGSYSALKRLKDSTSVLIWRGSTTGKDWVEDLDDAAQMVDTPDLGGVHPGFIAGVRAVQDFWDKTLEADRNLIVIGHSLGAGHAAIYSGHLVTIGRIPSKIMLCGSPRPGAAKLAGLISAIPEKISYRNQSKDGSAHDLVTDVPFSIPEIDPYEDAVPFTPVTGVPAPNDSWTIFRWHHAELYREGIAAL